MIIKYIKTTHRFIEDNNIKPEERQTLYPEDTDKEFFSIKICT